MDERAVTLKQKREIITRLYALWRDGDNKYLRLGQLIENAFHHTSGQEEPCIYNKEDYKLIEELESFYARLKKN